MAGRGPQSFKKRQKEQQRKEKQQEKLAKKIERRQNPLGTAEDDEPVEGGDYSTAELDRSLAALGLASPEDRDTKEG